MDLDVSAAFPLLSALIADMTRASVFIEIGALAACLFLAWFVTWQLRRMTELDGTVLFGERIFDGVLFPVLALIASLVAREILRGATHLALIKVVIPILMSLAAIRLTARVLRAALPDSRLAVAVERSVSWLAWIAVVLWVLGILQPLLEMLDGITWRMGGAQVSLGEVLHGALIGGIVVMLMLWLSSVIERRLTRGASASLSTRKIVASLVRIGLLFIGVIVTLSMVGIDLTAFSVLGGAIGVGVGFGLQNVVNNFVSGLILLFERPIQVGDTVQIASMSSFGEVRRIGIRSSTVRLADGSEVILPNGNLISEPVINWTLTDRLRRVELKVGVAYGTDPARVIALLRGAAESIERPAGLPDPLVFFTGFGDSSLDFVVYTWTDRMEQALAIRSELGLAVHRVLADAGIEIPFPQRDVHVRSIDPAVERSLRTDAEG